MTRSGICYLGVWFLIVNHCQSHGKSCELEGKADADKHCQGARMQRTRKVHVYCSQCMGFSVSLFLQTCTFTNFIVPEMHFYTKSIGTSSIVTAHNTGELFKFLHLQTQHDHTIIVEYVECIVCFSDILNGTFHTFNEVNHVPVLAVCCGGLTTKPLISCRSAEQSASFLQASFIPAHVFFLVVHMSLSPADP